MREAHRPEPKCLSPTGELIDIERVTSSLEGGRWKSTRWGTSLAAYPTACTVLNGEGGETSFGTALCPYPTPTPSSLRCAALRPESEMVAHHQSLQGQAGKYRATGPCGIQVPLPRRATA